MHIINTIKEKFKLALIVFMGDKTVKIYMDVCCLNRPFDNQNQDRIRIESEAIMSILFHCQQGDWELVGSEIIDLELSKLQNPFKKQKTIMLTNIAVMKIYLNPRIEARAMEYNNLGVDLFDSLHIACAEEAKADIMLSTDDNLLKRVKRLAEAGISIKNPVNWLMEVTDNEYND